MAIHGDPTVTSKVNWPKYNETNDINLRIDIPFSIETGLKKEKCDWCPKTDLNKGLKLTIDWYKEFYKCTTPEDKYDNF